MFLKAKSIILKAFPTRGSKFSSITFELHFDYIFCIFLQSLKLKTHDKNRQNTIRTNEKTANTSARIWQKRSRLGETQLFVVKFHVFASEAKQSRKK